MDCEECIALGGWLAGTTDFHFVSKIDVQVQITISGKQENSVAAIERQLVCRVGRPGDGEVRDRACVTDVTGDVHRL